jgi:uncharacterized cupredoxin-like copper-binding protein
MRRRVAQVAWLAVLVLAGCSGRGAATSVHVDLREFAIESSNTSLAAGHVDLEIENYGKYPHTLVVTDADGNVVAATDVLSPDEEVNLGLDLPPGQYEFTCRIVGTDDHGNVIDHYQAGMHEGVTSS